MCSVVWVRSQVIELLVVAGLSVSGALPAFAAETHRFDIPAEAAPAAIREFALQANVQILVAGENVRDRQLHAVSGDLSIDEGLRNLLADSGLTPQYAGDRSIALVAQGSSSQTGQIEGGPASGEGEDTPGHRGEGETRKAPTQLEEVVVTGSHIRGAPSASPVITITHQQMLEAGQTDLGQVVRSIPQNFSGGQNPGVTFATDARNTNTNITGGSALNLRGLGPDATLTLLNGHRLSYGASNQSVDISTIPIAAVNRIEVVPDGASALYGSDAVGGVANIILRRDYDGLSATARFGGATDGGDYQREYSVVGGQKWQSGGFIATYNVERDTPIYARQRDYSDYLEEPYMLLAGQTVYSLLASAHQDLGAVLSIGFDALYSNRKSDDRYTSPPSLGESARDDTNYSLAPSVAFHLPGAWESSLTGVLARDRADVTNTTLTAASVIASKSILCWCNSEKSVEWNAEGPLLRLPAGDARLAVGAGYRQSEFFNQYRYSSSTFRNIGGTQDSYFAFAELALPVLAPEQQIPLARRLLLSAAVRYENYNAFGGVSTPKLGLVYSPNASLDAKFSWGRSFKTPTLYQEYLSQSAFLYTARTLGGTGTGAALLAYGGNPDLGPETATTWSASLSFHPEGVPGLRIEPSYFNIRYRDRISLPIGTFSAALSSPIYREFVIDNPTLAQQQQAIAAAAIGLQVINGGPYSPSNVVALVRDRYTNVADQTLHGVDLPITYRVPVGPGTLTLADQMSWLHGQQRTTPQSPSFPIVGVIYNPPHFKARAGAAWSRGPLTVASFYNYLGGVLDNRTVPNPEGGSMSTVDLSLLYSSAAREGLLRGLEVALAVQNIADRAPPYSRNDSNYHLRYDSSNYSAIGRFVSVSVTKHW